MYNKFSTKINLSAFLRRPALALLVAIMLTCSAGQVSAQCGPTCKLQGVGLYLWMGDNDDQKIGDSNWDDEDGDDFIVFRNYSTQSVDISGWLLYTDQNGIGSPVFSFPSGTHVQPGKTVTIVGDWNGGGLPAGWFDANFNNGEGLFEETTNYKAFAILKNPSTDQYIVNHLYGASSEGPTLGHGTKICNTAHNDIVSYDFDGCETVVYDVYTCSFVKSTACDCPLLFNPAVICLAGNSSPLLVNDNINNDCPNTNIDLGSVSVLNQHPNLNLTWHTATPATNSNKVSDPSAVAPGTYYAAFYDPFGSCYSGSGSGTTTVNASLKSCCSAGSTTPSLIKN